jgi:DNA-binding GntR family transcriptional regulator
VGVLRDVRQRSDSPEEGPADLATSDVSAPLYSRVSSNLRADILDGVMEPGQHLQEQALAARYGVSRVPVRDALRRLEVQGLVEVLPNRGAFVVELGDREARDLLDVRVVLEEFIARQAAERRTDEQLAKLKAIVGHGLQNLRGTRPSGLAVMNSHFHQALAEASHNPTASALVEQLRARSELVYAGRLAKRAASSWHEHAEVVEAIERRDVDAAGEAMRSHLLEAAKSWPSEIAAAPGVPCDRDTV